MKEATLLLSGTEKNWVQGSAEAPDGRSEGAGRRRIAVGSVAIRPKAPNCVGTRRVGSRRRHRQLSAIPAAMGLRRCSGFAQDGGARVECCFNPRESGKKAQGKFEGKCMWCSPARLETVCMDARQRKLAARLLATLREQDVAVFDMATRRLSTHEGGDDVIARANVILSNRQQEEDDSPAEEACFRAEAERFAEEWSRKQMERRQLQGRCPFARQAQRERAAVSEFMSAHPLPAEQSVRQWLKKSHSEHLPDFRSASGIQSVSQAEELLDYDALKALWAMLADHSLESQETVQIAREAGLELHARGERQGAGFGQKCMLFHFYVLHYMVAGGNFHPSPREVIQERALAVALFTCHKEYVAEYWDGIGEWRN